MGVRLIEDFLARANTGRCNDFRETADVIAKVCNAFHGLSGVILEAVYLFVFFCVFCAVVLE